MIAVDLLLTVTRDCETMSRAQLPSLRREKGKMDGSDAFTSSPGAPRR